MSTAPTTITDQAGVNSAGSFDAAAESLLDLGGSGSGPGGEQEQTEGTTEAERTDAGNAGAGTESQGDKAAATAAGEKSNEQVAGTEVKADEWAIDQAAVDKLLADPVHGAIVKQLAEQRAKLLGYREHWTLEEAAAARALAPGGLEELKQSVQAGRDARAENAEFASADPARQAAALKTIAADVPEAFAAGVAPYLSTLKEVNPEAYTRTVGQIATEALKAEGLPDLISSHLSAVDALREAAEKGDEKAFGEAFAQVTGAEQFRDWAKKAGIGAQAARGEKTARVSPEVTALQKELQGYKDKEKAQQEQASGKIVEEWNGFTASVDKAWQESAKPEIEKLLEVIPKNMPTRAREQLVTRLSKEITGELTKKINEELEKGFGDLARKVQAVVGTEQAWKKNPDQVRTQAGNLIWARAKVLLPHVAKTILDPFSEATVASVQARVAQEDKTASRVDLRGGTSGPKAKTPLKAEDMKGKGAGTKLTDEEILDL